MRIYVIGVLKNQFANFVDFLSFAIKNRRFIFHAVSTAFILTKLFNKPNFLKFLDNLY